MKLSNLNLIEQFKTELADKESSFKSLGAQSYRIINTQSGALGKYQFMPTTIRLIANSLNVPVFSQEEFINNPDLQEKFINALLQENLNYIVNNNLSDLVGSTITGKKNNITTKINIYGLLAGAHLGGVGNLRKLLLLGEDKSDGNTWISDYVAYFSQVMDKKKVTKHRKEC